MPIFCIPEEKRLAKTECDIQDYQLLFPLPMNELMANPDIIQNAGY